MSPDGKRVGTPWYGRGIIRSCAKLAYEHAQVFIDEHNKGELCDDFSHFPGSGQTSLFTVKKIIQGCLANPHDRNR